ncbi:MAG: O-antigen ligase family protein, partial [Bryobacteraceae bacterium]
VRTVNRAMDVAIPALLFAGILAQRLPGRWPIAAFHSGVFLTGIVWMLTRREPAPRSRLVVVLAGVVALALVQLAAGLTVYRWSTVNALLYWTANLTLFVVAIDTFAQPAPRERFLRSCVYFGAAASLLFIFGFNTFPNRNHYAAFVELLLPLAVVAAVDRARSSLLHLVLAALLYASVIAAASRAGVVLVTLELIVILAIHRNRRSAALAGLAVAFCAVIGWERLAGRFPGDPFVMRREYFQSSVAMLRDRPLAGFGLGAWAIVYPGYALFDDGRFANHAHNDWIQWIVEGGLPMFLLMLAIAALSIRPAVRSLWGIGVPAVFLHSLVDYPLERPAMAGFFFVFLAILETVQNRPEP